MINSIHSINNFYGRTENLESLRNNNDFSKIFQESLNKINTYQQIANDSVVSFIKGNENEIHNVMIAIEEAKLTMQTAIEVRNKLIEAYQELSKVQI